MSEEIPAFFDRATGRFEQVNMLERIAARALQAGARASSLFAHRG